MGPPVHLTGGTGHGMFVSVERRTHRHRRIRLPRRRFRGRSRLPTRITPNRKRHHPLLPRGTPARRHPRPGGTARRLRAPPARPDRWAKAPGRIRLGPTSFGCSTAVPTGPRTAHPGFRSFGLSEADHSGSLSGSRPMQQRLVCVEAGQTFSIQRMKVLTPQVSSIHCRLTRGRTLVRSQPGPPTVYLRQYPNARTVLSSRIFLSVRFLSGRKSTVLVHPVKVGGDRVQLRVVKVAVDVGCDHGGGVTECALHKPQVSVRGAGQGCIGVAEIVNG